MKQVWLNSANNGTDETTSLNTVLAEISTSIQALGRIRQRIRHRSRVKDTNDIQLGRWAWDVFLLSN
jgi:hypothetical protein